MPCYHPGSWVCILLHYWYSSNEYYQTFSHANEDLSQFLTMLYFGPLALECHSWWESSL